MIELSAVSQSVDPGELNIEQLFLLADRPADIAPDEAGWAAMEALCRRVAGRGQAAQVDTQRSLGRVSTDDGLLEVSVSAGGRVIALDLVEDYEAPAFTALIARLHTEGFRVFTPQSMEEVDATTTMAEVTDRQDEIFS